MMTNGYLDLATLVEVQPGKYLQHDTAAAFAGLDAHSRAKYGIALIISEGGAYRTFEEQKRLRDDWVAGGKVGYPPARPGESTHGDGVTVDIWNWTHLTDEDLALFGFVRDVEGEGWHSHYIGTITPAGQIDRGEMNEQEKDMVRREARPRMYINTETGQRAAVKIETGYFRPNDGGDNQPQRWADPYLITGKGDANSPQKLSAGEWENLIGEVNRVRKEQGWAQLVKDWKPTKTELARVGKK